jgi:hypothetical protein
MTQCLSLVSGMQGIARRLPGGMPPPPSDFPFGYIGCVSIMPVRKGILIRYLQETPDPA